ncbi:MAG TPA: DNA gyrase subunit A, partial [Anaerolineaceae bacterium]
DDIAVQDLMNFIKGPDFPTGGIIIQDPQSEGLVGAYATGKGKVIVQARAHLEEMVRGRTRIIVTELPYMVNKSALIERIADLVRDGSIEGIADLRDESDRQGMRIVIEITKAVEPEKILQQLYRHTPMQTTFGINMLALVNGEPHLLTLKHALRVYISHRLEVVRRRSEFDLAKAKARAHILEGLLLALKNLDEVITIIRGSPDVDTARKRLIQRLRLSEIQAQAILDMQLRRLASLERKKIEEEYKEVNSQIKVLEALLKSPRQMRQMVIDELKIVRQTYSDRRRTQIVTMKEGMSVKAMLTTNDVMPAQNVWVTISEDGKVLRTEDDTQPRIGTVAPYWLLHTNTHHTLYLVSDQGKAAAVAVHALPEADKSPEGIPFYKVSPLPESEVLAVAFTFPPKGELAGENYLLSVTRAGMVKKSALSELPGPSAQSFVLAKVNEGDALGWARATDGKADLLLVTAQGMAIRFSEEEVRPMGLVAAGVNGLKLAVGDELVGVEVAPKSKGARTKGVEVLLVVSNGMAKRIALDDFPSQGRYGQGVIAWKLGRVGRLVGMVVGKRAARTALLFTNAASRTFRLDEAPLRTRAYLGQAVIKIQPGDTLLGMTQFWNGVEIFDDQTGLSGEEKPVKSGVKGKPAAKKGSDAGVPAASKPAAKARSGIKGRNKPAAKEVQPTLFTEKTLPAEKEQKKPVVMMKTPSTPKEPVKTIAGSPAAGKTTLGSPAADGKGKSAKKPAVETSAPKKTSVKSKPASETKPMPVTEGVSPQNAKSATAKPRLTKTQSAKTAPAKAGTSTALLEKQKPATGEKAKASTRETSAPTEKEKPTASASASARPGVKEKTPPAAKASKDAKALPDAEVKKTPKGKPGESKGKP